MVKGEIIGKTQIEIVDGAKAAYLFYKGTIGHAYPALVLPERLVNGEKREVGAAGTWLLGAKFIAHLPACEMP